MAFRYNIGDCAQSFHIHEANCDDMVWMEASGNSSNGTPTNETTYVKLVAQNDESEEYFIGTLSPGQFFDGITGIGRFEADSIIYMYHSEID